jgi:arylsulfatase A-like enzyme
VSLVDVAPTVLDVIGAAEEAFAGFRGRSLRWMLERPDDFDADAPRVVSVRRNQTKYFEPWHKSRGEDNIAVREGRWKGIFNVTPQSFELYDVQADPDELKNLTQQYSVVAARLDQFARDWLRREVLGETVTGTLTEEMKAKLRANGYLYDGPDGDDR